MFSSQISACICICTQIERRSESGMRLAPPAIRTIYQRPPSPMLHTRSQVKCIFIFCVEFRTRVRSLPCFDGNWVRQWCCWDLNDMNLADSHLLKSCFWCWKWCWIKERVGDSFVTASLQLGNSLTFKHFHSLATDWKCLVLACSHLVHCLLYLFQNKSTKR